MARLILLCGLVAGLMLGAGAATAQQSTDYREGRVLEGADRFAARADGGRDDLGDQAVAFFGEVVCPMLPAEFGCGCYLDGFKMPCDFVANCLSNGFCEPAAPSAGVILQEAADKGPLTLTIRPTQQATVATCSADDGTACDTLAAACEALDGVGQCGGDNNPDGCECVY